MTSEHGSNLTVSLKVKIYLTVCDINLESFPSFVLQHSYIVQYIVI